MDYRALVQKLGDRTNQNTQTSELILEHRTGHPTIYLNRYRRLSGRDELHVVEQHNLQSRRECFHSLLFLCCHHTSLIGTNFHKWNANKEAVLKYSKPILTFLGISHKKQSIFLVIIDFFSNFAISYIITIAGDVRILR